MVERHKLAMGASSVSSSTPSRVKAREQRCIWPGCSAVLARDHTSLVCSCHSNDYKIRQDRNAPQLILHLLIAAYPQMINLCEVLGTTDRCGVKDVVRKLRRHGHEISGHYPAGYRYELHPWNAPAKRATGRLR